MAGYLRYQHLVELFDTSVRRYPQRPLFGTKHGRGWRWMSYRDFASDVELVRASLAARGIGEGDRVAVISGNSPAWATVAFAAFGLGAVLVPIFPSSRHSDWLHILRDSGARLALCASSGIATRARRLCAELDTPLEVMCLGDWTGSEPMVTLEQLKREGGKLNHEAISPEPDATCLLIYTSGTTGLPKGVELTHRNIAANLTALREIFPVTEVDVALSFLPWAHAFGQVVELYGLMSVGASLALVESEQRLMHNLVEVRPTLLFSVPKLFNKLHDEVRAQMAASSPVTRRLFEDALDNARRRRRLREQRRFRGWIELKSELYDRAIFERARGQFGGRLRYAVCGGAPLAPEVADLVDSLGITLYEGYGLTETSPIVAANWPGARKLGSVGKPLPGVRVVIDKAASDAEDQGELVVYGDNVMRGYYHLPADNERVFTEDGGFRTGDLGYVDSDGFLFITGRIKERYKLDNGRYVVPTPIEESLCAAPFVRAAMVHGEGRPHSVALIVPEVREVRAWASERGLEIADDDDLMHHPAVLSLFEREVADRTRSFRGYERVNGFLLLDKDFSVEDGTLTTTMKVRRRIVARRYADRIDALYGVSRGRAHAVDE